MTTRRQLCAGLLAAPLGSAHGLAWPSSYPSQPIRLIVPYAPGGPTDIVARVVADQLGQRERMAIIVENRPGGGANIGAEAAARAPADGHTLLLATATHTINASLFPQLGYALMRDFVAVTTLTSGPMLLVTRMDSPLKSLPQLVTEARKAPATLSFASSGNGASTHLAGEMLNQRAGISSVHVPYRGSGPALTDTMSGQTSYMFDTMLSAMPFVNAGRLRALAITSRERSPLLPELPTVAEQGYPGFEAIAWNAVVAPARTPPQIVEQLNTALREVLSHNEVRDKFAAQGFSSDWRSPADTRQFMEAEIAKWGQIVKSAKVRVD